MEASEEEVQFFVHATNPMSANQIRLEDYIQVTLDPADWWFLTSFGATHLALCLCTLNQLQFCIILCQVMNCPWVTEEVETHSNFIIIVSYLQLPNQKSVFVISQQWYSLLTASLLKTCWIFFLRLSCQVSKVMNTKSMTV